MWQLPLRTSRAERAPDARIKLWLGYLEAGLVGATRFDGEVEPTYPFVATGGDDGYLPLAEALVEVAKDKFQFHTAESGETAPQPVAPAGANGEGRLARLEATMETMALTVKALGEQMMKAGTPPLAEAAAPKNVAASRLSSFAGSGSDGGSAWLGPWCGAVGVVRRCGPQGPGGVVEPFGGEPGPATSRTRGCRPDSERARGKRRRGRSKGSCRRFWLGSSRGGFRAPRTLWQRRW